MSTIDDLRDKKQKVDNIKADADNVLSKIDPVVTALTEAGNYMYGIRIVGKPYDDEALINYASTLNSYKEGLISLSNSCLVERSKLASRISELEAEEKRKATANSTSSDTNTNTNTNSSKKTNSSKRTTR